MSNWATEHILMQAANEPTLEDDGFVLLSRVMRGLDPFTGKPAQALETDWWVGIDGYGNHSIWLATSSSDPYPQQVISQPELDRHHPALWDALVAGLGISEDHILDDQESGDSDE